MAVPAIGFNRCVRVAGVTELLLARVTLHAGEHQTFLVLLPLNGEGGPVAVAQYLVSPDVEQFHMLGADLRSWQYAGLGVLGQNQFWYGCGPAAIVPNGYGDKQDENDQSRDYLTAVLHRCSSFRPVC